MARTRDFIAHALGAFIKIYEKLYLLLVRATSRRFPGTASESAHKILENVLYRNDVIDHLAEYDLQTCVTLFKEAPDSFEKSNFVDRFLRFLIANRGSGLYREVHKYQYHQDAYRRDFKGSLLLEALFRDIARAKHLHIWGPIGEYIIEYLSERNKLSIDSLNYGYDRVFRERGRFNEPIFVAIEYFDFMLTEAIAQDADWHMWLYNFRHWTEGICKNVNTDFWAEQLEWPSSYAYFLYEIISTQKGWLTTAIGLNKVSVKDLAEDQNSNIPKCTAQCITDCLKIIANCQRLPDRFKVDIGECFWDIFPSLQPFTANDEENLARFMLEVVKRRIKSYRGVDGILFELLYKSLQSLDKISFGVKLHEDLRRELEEFGKENGLI